jgi:hypothetical protein
VIVAKPADPHKTRFRLEKREEEVILALPRYQIEYDGDSRSGVVHTISGSSATCEVLSW